MASQSECEGTYGGDFYANSLCTEYGACCQATNGGNCWFLGALGESCADVCAAVAPGSFPDAGYDADTASYAGTGGSDANCQAVLNAVLNPDPPFGGSTTCGGGGTGCSVISGTGYRCTDAATNAVDSHPLVRRACACQ